jgi:hypothetical protein
VTRVLYASFVVALGALAACGRPDAQPPEASRPDPAHAAPALAPSDAADRLEARIEARRGSLVRKSGNTVAGDAASQWTAFYDGGSLLLIDDSVSLGDYGGSRVRFYFDEGRLRVYREEARRANSRTDERRTRTVSTRIVFDGAGAVAASTHQVDGRESTLPAAKVEEARNRSADLLRRLVLSR